MKVATLEKFHLKGWESRSWGPRGGKSYGGGEDFFPSSRGGTDPGWHYALMFKQSTKIDKLVKLYQQIVWF